MKESIEKEINEFLNEKIKHRDSLELQVDDDQLMEGLSQMILFKILERFGSKKVKLNLTERHSKLHGILFESRILFKQNAMDEIKRAKGWKNDAAMARGLDVSKAYISGLRKGKDPVTASIITKIASALNNFDNWHIYFEVVPCGVYDPAAPRWNQEKYMGKQPYGKYSSSADARSQDYNVEKEEI